MAEQAITKDVLTLLAGMVKTPSLINNVDVTSISMDSRRIEQGALFIATATASEQRILHIEQALEQGAKSILIEQALPLNKQEIHCLSIAKIQAIAVANLVDKVSEIAARFFGHPSLALTIIAITGTNGKTSVSHFIAQCLESSGQVCGVIGTLGIGRLDGLIDTGMTTPDPVSLQAALADFCHQSINTVVIEASSHALEQGRLNSVAVDVAVLTNLSRDHLDYHHDMATYEAAKKRLFDFVSVKTAVINAADDFGQRLISDLANRDDISVMSYSQKRALSTIAAKDIDTSLKGLHFTLISDTKSGQVQSSVLGDFNIDNLLATAGSLLAINLPFDEVIKAISKCRAINGRMQKIGNDKQATVVIDFAHTPDALEKALQSLRHHMQSQGQLWCVFGCGGDRDTGKRPLMGASAEHYADQVVLTADNPRSEDNQAIVTDILSGMNHRENQDKTHVEHDRKHAIAHAISEAKQQDIILIAGKGHEQFQEIAGIKHRFSDMKVVIEALAAANDANSMSIGVNE